MIGSLQTFVAAHQDDWMLFGGEHSARCLVSGDSPLLFIHITAGDAGLRNGWWEARELATVFAVQKSQHQDTFVIERPRICGHQLQCYRTGRAALYFLRCVDGGKQGKGFPASKMRSLTRLRNQGKILLTVDSSTRYHSWRDLCDTVAGVLSRELDRIQPAAPPASACLYCGDYDSSLNPGDHSDHHATADIVKTVANNGYFTQRWFLTYCSRSLDPNLGEDDLALKRQVLFSYGQELERLNFPGAVSAVQQEWEWWGNKSYSRLVRAGSTSLS